MPLYRSKPAEIEAVQLVRANLKALDCLVAIGLRGDGFRLLSVDDVCREFPGTYIAFALKPEPLYALVPTRHGGVLAREGDWIIRGIEGELYPCEHSVFVQRWELAA